MGEFIISIWVCTYTRSDSMSVMSCWFHVIVVKSFLSSVMSCVSIGNCSRSTVHMWYGCGMVLGIGWVAFVREVARSSMLAARGGAILSLMQRSRMVDWW